MYSILVFNFVISYWKPLHIQLFSISYSYQVEFHNHALLHTQWELHRVVQCDIQRF